MKKRPADPAEMKARFLREVAGLWPVAKGSVAQVRKPCVRAHCSACAEGRKHVAHLFTYRHEGRTRCLYVPADLVPRLRQALANGRRLEQRLAQLGRDLVHAHRQQRHAQRG